MTNYKHTLIFLIIFSLFISCGKNDKNEDTQNQKASEQKIIESNEILKPTDTTFHIPTDSTEEITASVLGNQHYKRKKNLLVINDTIKTETKTETHPNTTINPTVTPPKKTTKVSFVYIKKILNECEIGVTMSQEDLEKKFNIPKDAMKLVKSVTKVTPNELDIKWKSTWLVEKVSDARFKDGKLKVRFENNKMYTSGGAISINYEKEMYSDLVIIGRSAYIPSVKGYYWQIGKNK